jgi:hypothetical protein
MHIRSFKFIRKIGKTSTIKQPADWPPALLIPLAYYLHFQSLKTIATKTGCKDTRTWSANGAGKITVIDLANILLS